MERAPAIERGTRTRAGNNMSRSRVGILAGASECIIRFGTRKTTMGDIARVGGVAKATLYNHFRDKSELYAALVAGEVESVISRCDAAYAGSSGDPLASALSVAATTLSEHPVLRRIAETEPVVLGSVLRTGDQGPWLRARTYASGLLGSPEPSPAGDLMVRWVASHAGWPAAEEAIADAAAGIASAARALVDPA